MQVRTATHGALALPKSLPSAAARVATAYKAPSSASSVTEAWVCVAGMSRWVGSSIDGLLHTTEPASSELGSTAHGSSHVEPLRKPP